EATHIRLVRALEALLRRCHQPLLIVLEDIHWAGAESLKMFASIQALASELPLLLIASYRSDEHPTMPRELAGTTIIELGRLSDGAISELCASMFGTQTSAEPLALRKLATFVWGQSNGNAFLALEVMRTLAQDAGGLERMFESPLETLFAEQSWGCPDGPEGL